MAFDPYHKWLGIPKDKRPPTHYQLLAISPDETDPDAIKAALQQRAAYVRQFQTGPHSADSARLLNELSRAAEALCNPEKRRQYDAKLHKYHRAQKSTRSKSPTKNRRQWPFFGLFSFVGWLFEMDKGNSSLNQDSGLSREFAGIMAVIIGGFIIMAVVSFNLPWRKYIGMEEELAKIESAENSKLPPVPIGETDASTDENRAEPKEAVLPVEGNEFVVKVVPSDAEIEVKEDDVQIAKDGEVYRVSLPESFDKPSFNLTVSCLGFKDTAKEVPVASDNHRLTVELERLPAGEVRSIDADQGHVLAVVFSKDGRTFATGGEGSPKSDWHGSLLKVWETSTGSEQVRMRGHKSRVGCLAVSPDGLTLASGSYDKTIRLWDWNSGRSQGVLEGHTFEVLRLGYTPDGKTLLSAGSQREKTDDESIRIWNLSDRSAAKRRISPQFSIPRSLVIHPDGQRAYFVTAHKTVQLLKLPSGDTSVVFRKHGDGVYCVAVSPNGRYIVSGSATWPKISAQGDNSLRMWEAATGREVRRFQAHQFRPYCMAFSPDGKTLLTGDFWYVWKDEKPDPSVGCSVRLWDVASGKQIVRFKGHTDTITDVAISPNGRIAASTSYDGTIRLWSLPAAGEFTPSSSLSLKEKLAGTKWRNSNNVVFEWTTDGRFLHKGVERHWEVLDDKRVKITFGPKLGTTLLFNEDLTRFTQPIPGGTFQGWRE